MKMHLCIRAFVHSCIRAQEKHTKLNSIPIKNIEIKNIETKKIETKIKIKMKRVNHGEHYKSDPDTLPRLKKCQRLENVGMGAIGSFGTTFQGKVGEQRMDITSFYRYSELQQRANDDMVGSMEEQRIKYDRVATKIQRLHNADARHAKLLLATDDSRYLGYFIGTEPPPESWKSLRDLSMDKDTTTTTLQRTDIARIMLHVAQAVSAAHQAGYLHMNLQPSNIYVDAPKMENVWIGPSSLAYYIDVAIGVVVERGRRAAKKRLHHLADRTIPWTCQAPEVIWGAEPTEKSDVWAMGFILWELCTGEQWMKPRNQDEYDTILAHHSNEDEFPPHKTKYDRDTTLITNPLYRLACECILMDAERRPTMAQVEQRLAKHAYSYS